MKWLTRIGSVLVVLGLVALVIPEIVEGTASASVNSATCTIAFVSGSVSDLSTLNYTVTCTNFGAGPGDQGTIDLELPIGGEYWFFPIQWCGYEQVNCGNNPFTNWHAFAEAQVQYTGYTTNARACTGNGSGGGCGSPAGTLDGASYYDSGGNSWFAAPPYEGRSTCTLATYTAYGYDGDTCLYDDGSDENTVLASVIEHGYNGSTTFATTPCTLFQVTGPYANTLPPGSGYTYTMTYSIATEIVIASTDYQDNTSYSWSSSPPSNFSDSLTLDSKTFYDAFRASTPVDTPTSLTLDLSNLETNDAIESAEGWCYSGSTGWVDWGNFMSESQPNTDQSGLPNVPGGPAPTSPSDDGGAFSLSSCLDSSGLGLDPASWVPGLANDLVCGVKWLFVPTSSTLSSFENTFGISTNTPSGSDSASQWLGSLSRVLTTGPYDTANAILTDEQNGATSSVLNDGDCADETHHTNCVSIISSITAVEGVSQGATGLEILAWLLTAFFGVIFFIAIWRYLSRLLSGSA